MKTGPSALRSGPFSFHRYAHSAAAPASTLSGILMRNTLIPLTHSVFWGTWTRPAAA